MWALNQGQPHVLELAPALQARPPEAWALEISDLDRPFAAVESPYLDSVGVEERRLGAVCYKFY